VEIAKMKKLDGNSIVVISDTQWSVLITKNYTFYLFRSNRFYMQEKSMFLQKK